MAKTLRTITAGLLNLPLRGHQVGLCSFTVHPFRAWQALGRSSFGPPAGRASQPAALLTPTDGDPGGQVCQGSRLDGVNTATGGKAPAPSPLFSSSSLTVHLPYSITASSMTVKPLHRQNVTQHQVAGQENRMGHQEVSPNFSLALRALGRPSLRVPSPLNSAFESLSPPDQATPAAPSTQLVKALAAAWKSAAPPPNPGWGVGRRRQTSKLQLRYASKKKEKRKTPESQRGSPPPLELCAVHLDRPLILTLLCQGNPALRPRPGLFPQASARRGCGSCFLRSLSSPTTQRCEKLVKNDVTYPHPFPPPPHAGPISNTPAWPGL